MFTRAQALARGYSPSQISRRLGSAEWLVVQPRVYRLAGAPLTWTGRVIAATLAVRGAVGSHGTAMACASTWTSCATPSGWSEKSAGL